MAIRLPHVIRNLTRPFATRVPLPILRGPNGGLWWNVASYGSGYGTGRRALPQLRLIQQLLEADDCMWDIGAHHGYVTICGARAIGPRGHVHAFEPSAVNADILVRHLRWNGIDSATVHVLALSDFDGEARFGGTGTTKTFALDRGSEVVTVRRGASLIETGLASPPTFFKIDVEGAEAAVLRGLLHRVPPTARAIIAVHTREAYDECRPLLLSHGFRLIESVALRETAARPRWRPDPDLLAIGPASALPSDQVLAHAGYCASGTAQA